MTDSDSKTVLYEHVTPEIADRCALNILLLGTVTLTAGMVLARGSRKAS